MHCKWLMYNYCAIQADGALTNMVQLVSDRLYQTVVWWITQYANKTTWVSEWEQQEMLLDGYQREQSDRPLSRLFVQNSGYLGLEIGVIQRPVQIVPARVPHPTCWITDMQLFRLSFCRRHCKSIRQCTPCTPQSSPFGAPAIRRTAACIGGEVT